MSQPFVVIRILSPLESSTNTRLYDVIFYPEPSLHRGIDFATLNEQVLHNPLPAQSRCILLVPAELTRTIELGVISNKRSKALSAAPFLVEETLANDLTLNHIALAFDKRSKKVTACVVTDAVLRDLLNPFGELGIVFDAIYPDVSVVDFVENSVWLEGNRAVYTSLQSSVAIRADSVPLLFNSIDSQVKAIHLVGSANANSFPEGLQGKEHVQECDPWFPAHLNLELAPVNLAQGPYLPTTQRQAFTRTQWLVILSLLTALALPALVLLGLGLKHSSLSEQARLEQISIYQALYPNDKKIINIRAQLNNHLATLNQTEGENLFRKLMYITLRALTEHTGINDGLVRSLQYQDTPPLLSLEAKFATVESVESFQQALRAEQLTVKVDSLSQADEIYLGYFRVAPECIQC